MATLLPEGKQSFTNSAGVPLVGGRLYTYDAGTNNPRTTYQDAAATVPNTNPVIMDARGEATVFWQGSYKVELRDAANVLIWTVDQITDPASAATAYTDQLRADLADAATAGKGTSLLQWVRAGVAATVTTLKALLNWQSVNVFEFMSVAQIAAVQNRTLALDVTAACQLAISSAITLGKKKVIFPAGAYRLDGGAASPDGFKNGVLIPYTTGVPNFDPETSLLLEGEGGSTAFYCGADNMVLLRVSRNCTTVRDITLNANAHVNVWMCGVVPEDMTQTTTLVSQSFVNLENVNTIGAYTEGIVIQPGPWVGGSDSGCFYHNIIGGIASAVGGQRSVWLKKNVDWAAHPNRPTRTVFVARRTVRGNTGYQFDVGSEIELHGCTEELITSGAVPNVSPTARYVGDDVSANITYFGGYSEACTRSTRTPIGNKVKAYGYSFNSGLDVNEWSARAVSYDDEVLQHQLTPVLASSGGGAQGASTSTGYSYRQGKLVFLNMDISADKGTLAAGNLSVLGLQFNARTTVGTQWIGAKQFANYTAAPASNTILSAFISPGGFSLNMRKSRNDGAGDTSVNVTEFGATIAFSLQGVYITD